MEVCVGNAGRVTDVSSAAVVRKAEKTCGQQSAGLFHQQYFEGGISDRLLSAHQAALVIAAVNGLEALLIYTVFKNQGNRFLF